MGSMKRKRRKKLKKAWADFQELHGLSEECRKQARAIGVPPKVLQAKLADASVGESMSMADRIGMVYRQRQEERSTAHSVPPTPQEPRPRSEDDDHDRMIQDWKQNAERNDDENYDFLRGLKHRDYGFEPDELAGTLHQQAFQIVDCTRCANCCKILQPEFSDEDIDRIANHLDMEVGEFIEAYLEAGESGAYRTRAKPCPFLGEDDRCTIYEIRPTVCGEYPYTDKEGLLHRTIGVANNTQVCPAVFWIVKQMKHEAKDHQRNR